MTVVETPIRQTLIDVSKALSREAIGFAVIGGVAASVHGEFRITADVDVVAQVDPDGALAWLHAHANEFQSVLPNPETIARDCFLLPVKHKQTGVRVDIAFARTDFEKRIIQRAKRSPFAGASIPIVTAEDLILLKLVASRPQDTKDVAAIVARQRSKLVWDYLMQIGRQLQDNLALDMIPALQRLREKAEG